MSKFQFKVLTFVNVVMKENSWSFSILFIAIAGMLSFGLTFIFLQGHIGVLMPFSPFILLAVLIRICARIHNWGYWLFSRRFNFTPDFKSAEKEKKMLKELKQLSRKTLKELSCADAGNPLYQGREVEIKADFWSVWRLAKAFGYPVFRSMKLHSRISF